jgi:hypothetical protein
VVATSDEICKVGKKVLEGMSDRIPAGDMKKIAPEIKELCHPSGDWEDAVANLKESDHYDEFVDVYADTIGQSKTTVKNNFDNISDVVEKRDKKKAFF